MDKGKKRIIKRVLIVVVALLLALGGLQLFMLVSLYIAFDDLSANDGVHRTPQEMIDHFNSNYEKFELLNAEILELKKQGLERIDHSWSSPDDLSEVGISETYRDELMARMRELSLPRGVNCFSLGIKYISHTSGIMVSGSMDGYLYSTEEPRNYFKVDFPEMQSEPFLNYRDIKRPPRGSYEIYLKIRENWYIFKQYED